MRRLALVLCAALLAAACSRIDWPARLHAQPLYQQARALRRSPACSGLVPLEFGQTFPIPSRNSPAGYVVLFYPVVSSPGRAVVLAPTAEGRFDAQTGAPLGCARLPAPAPQELGPSVPPGLSMTEYYHGADTLYASLATVGPLYLRSRSPKPEEQKALADFAASFQTVAQPPLIPYYYRANPDFWEWLRRQNGRSIPKPAS